MGRKALLLVLLLGVVGLAAPTVTPTPWRYGVIYWVGGPPQHPEAYVNMATNWVERVFRFWGLLPVPQPSAAWATPEVVEAPTRAEARALLGSDLPPEAVLAVGPEPGTFWVLRPLLLGERRMQPLTLVVFPDVPALQDAVGHYGAGALFALGEDEEREHWEVAEPWLAELVGELGAPAVLAPRAGLPPFTPQDYFLHALAHEVAHWAMVVWARGQGLAADGIPPVLREGLATYTQLSFLVTPGMVPPPMLHPVATLWARTGSLTAVPRTFTYDVGVSLVDFLVRRHGWERLLVLLPGYLSSWEEHLVGWDEPWRAWLVGAPPPGAHVLFRIIEEGLPLCARMVQPLFPQAWDLVASVRTEADVDRFWKVFSQPVPPPSPELWEELRRRERMFSHLAVDREVEDEVRRRARELLSRLDELRGRHDWAAYTAAFLEGVRALFGLPVPVEAAP